MNSWRPNSLTLKFGCRAPFALLLAVFGTMAVVAVSAQPVDRSRFPEMIESVRHELAPFDSELTRNKALSKFGCGSVVRGSFRRPKKVIRTWTREDGLTVAVLDGEKATATIAVSDLRMLSDGATVHARIKRLAGFPTTEPLADVPEEFILGYFGGTRDATVAKPRSKIESGGGLGVNYWFVDGKLKEIEFFCNAHDS